MVRGPMRVTGEQGYNLRIFVFALAAFAAGSVGVACGQTPSANLFPGGDATAAGDTGDDGSEGGADGGGFGTSSGTSSGTTGSSGGTAGASSGGPSDAGLSPDVFAGGGGGGSCLGLGSACSTAGDCCSGDCATGECAYPPCVSDKEACSKSGQCCSQTCGASGTCTPLNTTCKTLGNACTQASQCCSGLCSGGTCQASSFCGQAGDSCATGSDCCTGTCTVASGQKIGTCSSSPPGGPANCGMVDGQLCGGLGADGGVLTIDGGLPQCGGGCCSRACAPWGPTGVLVCQPASGCHPVGDLCMQDGDCCGASGIAGGSGKPVTCVITAPATIGVCRLPMGCKPNGDVCRLAAMECSETCDCCAGNCHDDTCLQDNLGVPRCAFSQCVSAAGSCASSADCCNGDPCVPNPSGTPPYVCSAAACVSRCGACTTSADCCPGTSCSIAQGSTNGICGPCGATSTSSSGGGTGTGGTSSGGTSTGGSSGGGTSSGGTAGSSSGGSSSGGTTCSLYGQICSASSPCCGTLPCTNGRCLYPVN